MPPCVTVACVSQQQMHVSFLQRCQCWMGMAHQGSCLCHLTPGSYSLALLQLTVPHRLLLRSESHIILPSVSAGCHQTCSVIPDA